MGESHVLDFDWFIRLPLKVRLRLLKWSNRIGLTENLISIRRTYQVGLFSILLSVRLWLHKDNNVINLIKRTTRASM